MQRTELRPRLALPPESMLPRIIRGACVRLLGWAIMLVAMTVLMATSRGASVEDLTRTSSGSSCGRQRDGCNWMGSAQLEFEGQSPLPGLTLLVVRAHEELSGLRSEWGVQGQLPA